MKTSADVLLGLRLMQMLSLNSLIRKVNKHAETISIRVLTGPVGSICRSSAREHNRFMLPLYENGFVLNLPCLKASW